MNIVVLAVMYGLLLHVVLGGFLITVCTDYPEHLRAYREILVESQRRSYAKVVLIVLLWYVLGLAFWPIVVRKYRV